MIAIVYRAIAPDGTVLYVGVSGDLSQRLRQHASGSDWWSLHDHIECGPPMPLERALVVEADLIERLRPSFNRNGGSAGSYGPHVVTDDMRRDWKERYETGATIESLALDNSMSTNTMRKHLRAVDTEMRRPGPRAGTRHLNVAHRREQPSQPNVVVHAFTGTRGTHRRRGRAA